MRLKFLCMVAAVLSVLFCQVGFAFDSRDSQCPKHAQQRSAAQVLQAHAVAFETGNAALLACDYAKEAVFIIAGSVAQGPDEIEGVFASFFDLASGHINVTTHSLTIADDVALFEYSVSSDHVVVADGVDTFVIDKGFIIAHTAHLGGFATK